MKRTLYCLLLFTILLLSGCSRSEINNDNRYLPDYNFSIDINFDLPLYNNLRFTGNPVYIDQAGIGINGIFVLNTGGGYVAYEASCPNQELNACSRLVLNGITAICPCDDAEYSLFSGQAEGKEYPLKIYRVEILGNTGIRVYN